jgi:hypothetical protein
MICSYNYQMRIGIVMIIIGSSVILNSCRESIPEEEHNMTVFAHDIMKDIPQTNPEGFREKLKHVKITGLKGEFEPFSFSIHCKKACNNVSIQVSDLKKTNVENDEIKSDFMEVNRLKKDEALHGIYDWTLCPVDNVYIKEGGETFFWVTLFIPVETAAGNYKGYLGVDSDIDEPVEIPVELRVLPEKLEDPRDVQFVMLYTVSPFGQHFDPETYNELAPKVLKFYNDLRNHGMTAISPKNSDWPYRKGNIDGLKAEVRLAARAGFKGPVLWYMSSLINGAKCGKRYAHYDGNCSTWNESRDIANLRQIVADVKEAENRENWPEVIFITVDEPGTVDESRNIRNLRMEILEKTMNEVHALGAKGATTLTEPLDNKHNTPPFVEVPDDMRKRWDRVRPFCAVRIYGYGYPEGATNLFAEKLDAERRGYEIWVYYNEATMGDRRYVARVFYGLWGWKIGARGLASWTYPGARSVQWELVREGIDDHKYMVLIQRLSEKLPRGNEARSVAERFLMETFNRIELDGNGYIKNWNEWKEFDFVEFRQRAANIIEQLSH